MEEIPKKDLTVTLKAATNGCYYKTKHTAQLLRRIRPDRVTPAVTKRGLFATLLSFSKYYRSPKL